MKINCLNLLIIPALPTIPLLSTVPLVLYNSTITWITYITTITLPCTIIHWKNKIVKITNLLVRRNNGNGNLIGCVACYDCMMIYMQLWFNNIFLSYLIYVAE